MLPEIQHIKIKGIICKYCKHVNGIEYNFCTNCSYPLQDKSLVASFNKMLAERKDVLLKAVNAVFIARNILYAMAAFSLLGLLGLFFPIHAKYVIAIFAIILSGLFFFLAFWSRREPFPAIFTSFIILVTFSAINLFNKLDIMFTTSQSLISLVLCVALLFTIMRGLQGAYTLRLYTGIKRS